MSAGTPALGTCRYTRAVPLIMRRSKKVIRRPALSPRHRSLPHTCCLDYRTPPACSSFIPHPSPHCLVWTRSPGYEPGRRAHGLVRTLVVCGYRMPVFSGTADDVVAEYGTHAFPVNRLHTSYPVQELGTVGWCFRDSVSGFKCTL